MSSAVHGVVYTNINRTLVLRWTKRVRWTGADERQLAEIKLPEQAFRLQGAPRNVEVSNPISHGLQVPRKGLKLRVKLRSHHRESAQF